MNQHNSILVLDEKSLADLLAGFVKLEEAISVKAYEPAFKGGAHNLRDLAKMMAPVRTGSLAKSIKFVMGKRKRHHISGSTGVSVETLTNVPVLFNRAGKRLRGTNRPIIRKIVPSKYAHLVEFGTVRSKPHPFMRKAYDLLADSIAQDIENAMKAALDL